MRNIKDIFAAKPRTFSIEIFPAKTEKGYQKLLQTIDHLAALEPDFFSCTYGAGGGSRDRTFDLVQHIQEHNHIVSMAHLTCVCHTQDDIRRILKDIHGRGIRNILALRGDPPQDNPGWQPGAQNFQYASELVRFIREELGQDVGIGVAGFPEGHVLCPDREQDAQYLKYKIDAGADFVITQLFFNNQDYFEYVERLSRLGLHLRVIPGILPITNVDGLERFCATCGTTIPAAVRERFDPIRHDPDKVLAEGIRFAVRQCQELLKGGAPGLHFYALNKVHPVNAILAAVREVA